MAKRAGNVFTMSPGLSGLVLPILFMVLDKLKCDGSGLGRSIFIILCSLLLILFSYSYISSRTLKAELLFTPCRKRKENLPTRGLGKKFNLAWLLCDLTFCNRIFRINYYPRKNTDVIFFRSYDFRYFVKKMDAIEQVSCWPPPQSTQGHDTGVYNAMETIRSFF